MVDLDRKYHIEHEEELPISPTKRISVADWLGSRLVHTLLEAQITPKHTLPPLKNSSVA